MNGELEGLDPCGLGGQLHGPAVDPTTNQSTIGLSLKSVGGR